MHENASRLEHFLDAWARHDAGAVGGALAADVVWHVGGTHAMSGDYRGRQAVVEYFERVAAETAGTLALHPIEFLANDARGAAFLRVTASRDGRELDVTMAEAFEFDADGRIREFWGHASDQAAIDAFWGGEG